MDLKSLLLEKVLTILSNTYRDGVYKDMIIHTEITDLHRLSLYRLCVKGEKDKGTPFYCGSVRTHIVREDYFDGKVVFAEILSEEERNKEGEMTAWIESMTE